MWIGYDLIKVSVLIEPRQSLLFIPAGTGVIVYAELIREQWLALSSALLVSSLAAIAVTALMLQWLLKKKKAMQSTSSSKAKP